MEDERTLHQQAEDVKKDVRTVTLTKQQLICEGMDAILNDETIKHEALMFMFAGKVLSLIVDKFFPDESGDAPKANA